MNKISDIFKSKKFFHAGKGATADEIKAAEENISVTFSNEYKEYVSSYGFAVYEGHELTGITNVSRLNVVSVTTEEREYNPDIPLNWYVIEQLNIDSSVIWQSETGEIFQTFPNSAPVKINDSLADYLKS